MLGAMFGLGRLLIMRALRSSRLPHLLLFLSALSLGAPSGQAQDDNALATQLANPLAALISVPFQFNYNTGYGAADGDQWLLNIQPVIPISLNSDWNLISRTIIPVIAQNDIFGKSGEQSGFGDTLQSAWLSPAVPAPLGDWNLIWGVGGAFLLPTSTDRLLGAGEWGAGPTAVALVQQGPWTVGGLTNHVWSFDAAAAVNSTFLQPFAAYSVNGWTYSLNTESSYNWNTDEWSVPINAMIAKVVKFGNQPVQLQGGVRYWAESPTGGPDGWGGRAAITFLFPKGG